MLKTWIYKTIKIICFLSAFYFCLLILDKAHLFLLIINLLVSVILILFLRCLNIIYVIWFVLIFKTLLFKVRYKDFILIKNVLFSWLKIMFLRTILFLFFIRYCWKLMYKFLRIKLFNRLFYLQLFHQLIYINLNILKLAFLIFLLFFYSFWYLISFKIIIISTIWFLLWETLFLIKIWWKQTILFMLFILIFWSTWRSHLFRRYFNATSYQIISIIS